MNEKKKLIICSILLFMCINCLAQKDSIVFLDGRYKKSGLLLSLNNVKDPDSAIQMYQKAVQKYIDEKCDTFMHDAYMCIGERYMSINNNIIGIKYYNMALPYCYATEDSSNCYNHLGLAFFVLGDYVQATENFYAALHVAIKNDKPYSNLPAILDNLGEVNFRLHQYDKALYYYNQAEPLARKQKDSHRLDDILLNKAELFTYLHQPEEARKYLKEVIDLADTLKRPDLFAAANEQIGLTYIESHEYKKALQYLQIANKSSKYKTISIDIAPAFYLADAYFALGNYEKAESILIAALTEAGKGKLRTNRLKGYTTLTEVYKATGQYKKALYCMDSILVLKDSIESAAKVNAINLMDIKFQTAKKDKQIAENQLVMARQNNKITQKNIWIISITGSVLLLLLISIGGYRNVVHKQKLQAEQIKLINQEKKIDILKALIQGEDNERSRIARELHDGVGGMLSAAMMRYSAMHHDNKTITQTPAYHEVMNILIEMGDEIRKTAHNLMPEVLLKQNLPEAIRVYCNNVETGGTLKIDFQYFGIFENLTENFKLNVYRIIQELLKNITQHAHASHAFVQLLVNEDVFTLIVEDDGVGFDNSEIKNGLGLHNLQTRVTNLDGHISMNSQKGNGLSIFIEFDLRSNYINQVTRAENK